MERDNALDMALSQIEKQFGKGSVMRMGENLNMGIEAISTGAMSLDLALGIGGLPRGRIVEIYGPESSGKSTLAMHVVAEAQRNGGICAYVDAEHAMDPVYARAIGVNVDDLLISQPDTGEQALEISDMLIRSGALDVLVIDSVAALTPRAEIEGEMGDTHVGLQARLMSQALRKLTGTLSKTNTIAIFINQLREKMGVIYGCFSVRHPGGAGRRDHREDREDREPAAPGRGALLRPERGRCCRQAGGELVRQREDRGIPADHGGQAQAAREGSVRRHAGTTSIRTPGGWREAGDSRSGTGSCRPFPITCPTSNGRYCGARSWATEPCPLTRSGPWAPVSASAMAPSRSPTPTGRRRCSPISVS